MPTPNLTDEHRAYLARFLREAIAADRYPLSPRVRRLKKLLAKIDPAAGRDAVTSAEAAGRPQRGGGEEAAAVKQWIAKRGTKIG
jgi:hypothetical protein